LSEKRAYCSKECRRKWRNFQKAAMKRWRMLVDPEFKAREFGRLKEWEQKRKKIGRKEG